MLDKDYLLKRIDDSSEELSNIFKTINHYEAFRTLLCLLDIFTDVQIKMKKAILTIGSDEKSLRLYNNNFLHLQIIYTLIDFVLGIAPSFQPKLYATPRMETFVMESRYPDFPGSDDQIALNYDLEESEVIYWGFNLQGDSTYYRRYFIIKNAKDLNEISPVKESIRLIQVYWRLLVARSALTQNSHFEIDSDGKLKFFTLPNNLSQKPIMQQRDISVETFLFPNWNMEVVETHAKTLDTLDNQIENRQNVLNEFKVKKSAFESLPNFSNIFFEYYKIPFDDYYSIITEICMLAYDRISDRVIRLPRVSLIKQIKRHSGKAKVQIEKILDDFTWKKGETIFDKFVIFDGNYYTYSWDTALYSTELPMQHCFEKLFNNDPKGKHYEEECRKIFRTNSLFVCDGRLLIQKQIVPNNFFTKYKIKIKKETDLDVIGSKLDILFIIECKEKKRTINITNVYNELKKNYNELLWKAKWIAEHREEFVKIVKEHNYEIPDFNYIVPLLVTNIVNPDNNKYNSVNFSELNYIINNIQITGDSYVTNLPTGIVINIPIFRI